MGGIATIMYVSIKYEYYVCTHFLLPTNCYVSNSFFWQCDILEGELTE